MSHDQQRQRSSLAVWLVTALLILPITYTFFDRTDGLASRPRLRQRRFARCLLAVGNAMQELQAG